MGPINQYGSMPHYRGETHWPSDCNYDDEEEGNSPCKYEIGEGFLIRSRDGVYFMYHRGTGVSLDIKHSLHLEHTLFCYS